MRTARAATIYDSLRIEVMRNGAIKSPSPQSERPVIASSILAGRDANAIGVASTTARSSRTYTAGDLQPQGYLARPPAGFQDMQPDVGRHANTRAALPNRGLAPRAPGPERTPRADRRRARTPMAKRR